MPTITFQVNLETCNRYNHRQPCDLTTEADNFSSTRNTWFPDILKDNRELKHGDEFTLSGTNALYMKNNYTIGEFKFLDIILEVSP